MKLRLLPILVALIGSTVILFGGWFVYHSYAMENPLADTVKQVQGVKQTDVHLVNNQAVFDLTLSGNASLRDIYARITADGAKYIGSRQVKLNITSDSSPALEAWWSGALFDVAQAMDTKQYAQIPQALQARAAQLPGLQVATEMDEVNVYVRLTDGNHSKYIVLPRVADKMGVFSNE